MSSIINLKDRLKDIGDKTTITLSNYIQLLKGSGSFVIPDYQRGYVWGQRKKNSQSDSVSFLINSLKESYNHKSDIFLQGITVHEKKESFDIVLVDGQQRTTFFYLLLKYTGYKDYVSIKYDIRKESNDFLINLDKEDCSRNDSEEYQDIFFRKRTLRIFARELKDIVKEDFRKYILEHVKFLFVIIPEEQAKIVFTMMNGNKAKMTNEELIKAELLRCASLEHNLFSEAEHIALRGRLAREWDSWLYWWSNPNVESFFRTGGKQLGWLLPLVCESSKVSFDSFKDKLLKSQTMKQSKSVFKQMRLLQKLIEDAYNYSISYNYLGVILYIRNNVEQRFAFLRWYFGINQDGIHFKSIAELKRYYDWAIIGVNHEDIVAVDAEKYSDARNRFYGELKSNMLFMHHYETAYRWLLHQNIKQDNFYNDRKFDFNIECNRSLEHVYPKSKIGHKNDQNIALGWNDEPIKDECSIALWREEMEWTCKEDNHVYHGSEHCIGNLVLLYKRDNSKFNDADFRKKNQYFFTDQDDESFKSRHLIHTTMVFSDVNWEDKTSDKPWNKEQIPMRKYAEIKEFENEYPEIYNQTN